jgi:hypothetical protein
MRPVVGLLVLFLAAAAAPAQPVVGPEPNVPIRIMPLGDSITEGSDGGFRYPLMRMITQAFELPDLVGRRTSRESDHGIGFDHDQDGYSAYRIDQIADGAGFWHAPPIEQRLDDWDPAVVLVHAGTNDAQQNYYPFGDPDRGIPNVVDRLDSLVSRIVAHAPHVYVIVAQIIPANPPASETTIEYVERFNARIPEVVARHRALGHRVSLVDMYTPLLAFPNPDGIHPSPEGFRRMAEVWFEGLRAIGYLDGAVRNLDRGRDDGVRQLDLYTTATPYPWAPSAESLIRDGAPTLLGVFHEGYDGSAPPSALNDGSVSGTTNDGDDTWVSTFVLDTRVNAAGYDVTSIRSGAGGVSPRKLPQAYEVWWSSVDAPTDFVRLGDFTHIPVNDTEQGSALVIRGVDGPLARGVKALQFRFVRPPVKQRGLWELDSDTRYYEVEALGVPTAGATAGAPAAASEALPAAFALEPARPNPFRGHTLLDVAVPEAGRVRLAVYDVLGREVALLLDGAVEAGRHRVRFDAAHLPGGTYVARLEGGGQVATRPLTLVR